ncbi:MAG: metallophosphoesterase [Myxococcaceae bacterium]
MVLRLLGFFAVLTVIVGGTHLFLYRRLVRDVFHDRRRRRLGAVVLALLALVMLSAPVMLRVAPGPATDVLLYASYTWMGLWFLTFWILLVPEIARGVSALVRRLRPGSDFADEVPPSAAAPRDDVDTDRRLFLSRTVAGGAMLAAGGLGTYGLWRAYAPPVVSEVPIRLRGLPRALDGFSIVQLTDIHVGNLIERTFMDELVGRANALRPDLVAITGDLVDGPVPHLGQAVAALGNLKARYGRWFITGNHEYYSGDEAWVAFLESIGIPTLRNRHVQIGDAGASFDLIGVDDWSLRGGPRGYDLEKAVAGRDPERAGVLLAHQPANFRAATEKGIGLQLSGHTHGGQLFPFTLLVGIQWEHRAGLYQHDDASIYVSRGCGFWGPPMRVGAPPEIVKIVLTSA